MAWKSRQEKSAFYSKHGTGIEKIKIASNFVIFSVYMYSY